MSRVCSCAGTCSSPRAGSWSCRRRSCCGCSMKRRGSSCRGAATPWTPPRRPSWGGSAAACAWDPSSPAGTRSSACGRCWGSCCRRVLRPAGGRCSGARASPAPPSGCSRRSRVRRAPRRPLPDCTATSCAAATPCPATGAPSSLEPSSGPRGGCWPGGGCAPSASPWGSRGSPSSTPARSTCCCP